MQVAVTVLGWTRPLLGGIAVVVSTTIAAGCVNRQVALPREDQPATCRELVDASNRAVTTAVAWRELSDGADRLEMAESCGAVGPAVYVPPPHVDANPPAADSLAILSWNVHAGGGDIVALVDALRSGRLTKGEPARDFVLLLQEVFRRGVAVPDIPARGIPIPRRIEESPPGRPRQDIVQVAHALGLGVFYLPSMRNGAEQGSNAEDRGNAILSTRPLSNLTGIELPFERQRRIAAAATVTGTDTIGNPWGLRLVSAHLNATASVRRLWVFAAAARARQASHLANALAGDDIPTVIGMDLNSWAGGAGEPAYKELREHFPQTPEPGREPTFRGEMILDYIFLRAPAQWLTRFDPVDGFFGSDHRPLIGWVAFTSSGAGHAASSATGVDRSPTGTSGRGVSRHATRCARQPSRRSAVCDPPIRSGTMPAEAAGSTPRRSTPFV